MSRTVVGVIVATLGLLLSGCGSPSPDTAAPGPERVVTDSTGEVRIPADVERILTVHHSATQPLTDLGVVPVGRGAVDERYVAPATWATLKDVPVVATGLEVNVEEIARLDPDLIMGHNRLDQGLLAQLRALAPVLVLDIVGTSRIGWQGKVNLVARAIGKEAPYQDLLRDFDTRAAEVAKRHQATLADERFVVVGSWQPGTIRAYGSESVYGSVFAQAGATIAEAEEREVAETPERALNVSQERAPEILDGTALLFVTDLRAKPNSELADLMADPVFKNIAVVKTGRVYPGGKDTVGGFEDANYNLDLFDAALTTIAGGA